MSRPNRRGSFANTAVWTCALLAIGGLTVWKFEIWPIGLEPTQTGSLDDAELGGEKLAAAPIEVAGSESDLGAPTPVEPAAGTADLAPPPSELSELGIDHSLPIGGDAAPPAWPTEPGKLPAARNAKPLRTPPRAAPLTGSDFADADRYAEPAAPAGSPPGQSEPAQFDPAPATELQPAGGERTPAAIVPSSAEESAVPGGEIEPAVGAGAEPTAQANPGGFKSLSSTAKAATESADSRLAAIDADIAANKFLAAHKALSKLYWDEPELRSAIAGRIDTTARSIYFDPQPHYMAAYEVAPGDQLRVVARQFNVPWEYLVRLNRIGDPSRLKAGQAIKTIKGPFSAVVDLSDFTLTLHAHGYYVRRYPVGVGKDGSTPMGTFRVVLKESNPKYYGPDVVMERDDPANPLGERWIGLDDGSGRPTSYGIHGTIDPGSIGKAESRGCVRLRNEDVAEVYDLLGVGSEVVIQR